MISLFASPLSHYARKDRILLDLYGIDYEFKSVGEVGGTSLEAFAQNPLMKVPTLVDGPTWIVDSDHIARYLVRKYDPKDRYRVLDEDIAVLNARAILNGIMQEEVKLILAHRSGVPTEQYAFFDKARKAIDQGLQWLEDRADLFNAEKPAYLDFHLVCLWEHLACYKFSELEYPKLRPVAETVGEVPAIHRSSPYHIKPRRT